MILLCAHRCTALLHEPFDARCPPPQASLLRNLVQASFGKTATPERFLAAEEAEATVAASSEVDLTYGELDLDFFLELISHTQPRPSETFFDIGSGCGRLVVSAALHHPWQQSVGIEVVPALHEEAVSKHRQLAACVDGQNGLSMSPCTFICELAETAVPRFLGAPAHDGDGDSRDTCVAFMYANTWPCGKGFRLERMSDLLGRHLPTGSRVVVVGRRLVPEDPDGLWSFDEIGYWQHTSSTTGVSSSAFLYERLPGPQSPVDSDEP